MKAWIVRDKDDEYAEVVFAETRNKARLEAQSCGVCEDMTYLEIIPRRFYLADKMYKGKSKMDWDDPRDRRFLCENGWHCEERSKECESCSAKYVCDLWMYKKDEESWYF